MEKYFKKIIEKSGENPSREGLKKTLEFRGYIEKK